MSALNSEQPRHQGEQRALAGAVEAKQRRKARRRDAEIDVDQGAAIAVGMADAADRKRRRLGRIRPGVNVRRGSINTGLVRCRHGCAIAIPQGSSPTWIVLITFCAATSMTETSLDTPLVTSRYFSSGVNAICQTRCPTSRYLVTLWLAASTTATRLAGPNATNAVLASAGGVVSPGGGAPLRTSRNLDL